MSSDDRIDTDTVIASASPEPALSGTGFTTGTTGVPAWPVDAPAQLGSRQPRSHVFVSIGEGLRAGPTPASSSGRPGTPCTT